jgi:hypothetical protein
MVLMFGFLVVPLGITSIVLVMLQPVAVGSWCTLCLITAVAMLIMIPLAVDEVVAMGQFLVRIRRQGKPFWRTFWRGGTLEDRGEDQRTPRFPAPMSQAAPAMIWGVTAPWNLVAAAILGIWLMAGAAFWGGTAQAAANDVIAGAVITTVAVVAMAEVTRSARFLNLLLGVWMVISPWILSGATTASGWNDAAVGFAVLVASLRRGVVRSSTGHGIVWCSSHGADGTGILSTGSSGLMAPPFMPLPAFSDLQRTGAIMHPISSEFFQKTRRRRTLQGIPNLIKWNSLKNIQ